MFESNAFHFHPLKYVYGVAAAVAGYGIDIHEHSAALAIERQGGKYLIKTAGGEVLAEQVVFAAGGYARGLYRPVERATLPIATYVVATEPLGEALKDSINCESAIYDTRFAFDYYRPLADSRILWAGAFPSSTVARRRSPACSKPIWSRSTRNWPMWRSSMPGAG